jgi:hypothetical protein
MHKCVCAHEMIDSWPPPFFSGAAQVIFVADRPTSALVFKLKSWQLAVISPSNTPACMRVPTVFFFFPASPLFLHLPDTCNARRVALSLCPNAYRGIDKAADPPDCKTQSLPV